MPLCAPFRGDGDSRALPKPLDFGEGMSGIVQKRPQCSTGLPRCSGNPCRSEYELPENFLGGRIRNVLSRLVHQIWLTGRRWLRAIRSCRHNRRSSHAVRQRPSHSVNSGDGKPVPVGFLVYAEILAQGRRSWLKGSPAESVTLAKSNRLPSP